MKLATSFLILVLLLIPFQSAMAGKVEPNVIKLTASQVDGANDIEEAIILATAEGTRPGTVILNGREGPFVFTDADRSLNIFVSDLTLRGVKNAVIKNCDDGLFFDDFPIKNILVEDITFRCTGDGVEAAGEFQGVTLRDNQFQVGGFGIASQGPSSEWLITGNLIQAGGDGIGITGADQMVITNNHLSGNNGIILMGCARSEARHNAIQAAWQGVLLGQESWKNTVQANTILGVQSAGIALEPDVTGNLIVANRVICATRASCVTVDASEELEETNTIAGNKP